MKTNVLPKLSPKEIKCLIQKDYICQSGSHPSIPFLCWWWDVQDLCLFWESILIPM